MNKLQKKTKDAKERAEEIAGEHLLTFQNETERDSALKMLGAIHAGINIGNAVSTTSLRALEIFLDNREYEKFGFTNLTDFLNNSEHSPMSKGEYYRQIELLRKEGDATFEYLNALKIPASTRKMIGAGNISFDGDKILVGEIEVASTDTAQVKEIIKELANEIRDKDETEKKSKKQIEKLNAQIETGKDEYEQLQRNFDALNDGSPFDQTYSKLVNSFIRFNDHVKEAPDDVKKAKGENCLDTIWTLLEETRRRFGSNRSFQDSTAAAAGSDRAKKVFEE